MSNAVYEQLFQESEGEVTAYRGDFKHDETAIENHGNEPFIHIAYDCGTHIYHLPPADSDYWPAKGETRQWVFDTATREEMSRQIRDLFVNYFPMNHADHLWHYYDGETLQTITPAMACDIADEWRVKLLSDWN